jgi:branched-subunit amino acid transport protein
MSARATFWLIIVVLAAGTWAMRSLPIMVHGAIETPRWIDKLLRHVPVAALTALVVPGVLYLKIDGVYEFSPARLLAGVAALAIAVRTGNVVGTLVVGMGVLWAVQALITALA